MPTDPYSPSPELVDALAAVVAHFEWLARIEDWKWLARWPELDCIR